MLQTYVSISDQVGKKSSIQLLNYYYYVIKHMVSNHQDGYPYLNLHFFLLKISENFNFFGKTVWSINSGRQRAGDS